MRRLLPLLAAALMALGCTFGTLTPTATPTEAPTQAPVFIDARGTATIPAQAAASATPAPTVAVRPNCVIRTDWFLYAVYPGETLSRIAARAGTTANALAAANCLANPDRIYAGQLVRVPVVLPPVLTATRPPMNITLTSPPPVLPPALVVNPTALSVTPNIGFNNNTYTVQTGAAVTLTWNAAFPAQTMRVDFYLIAPATGVAALIGTDVNVGDGSAQALWIVTPNVQGTIRAVASFSGGSAPFASSDYYVVTDAVT